MQIYFPLFFQKKYISPLAWFLHVQFIPSSQQYPIKWVQACPLVPAVPLHWNDLADARNQIKMWLASGAAALVISCYVKDAFKSKVGPTTMKIGVFVLHREASTFWNTTDLDDGFIFFLRSANTLCISSARIAKRFSADKLLN